MSNTVLSQVKDVVAQANYNRKDNLLHPDDAKKIKDMKSQIDNKISELERAKNELLACEQLGDKPYS